MDKQAAAQAYRLGVQQALLDTGLIKQAALLRPSIWEEQRRQDRALDAAMLASVGIPTAALGVSLAGEAVEQKFTPEAFRKTMAEKLRSAMSIDPDLKIDYTGTDMGAFFHPGTKTVKVGPKPPPSTLAHELGHGSGMGVNRLYPASKAMAGAAVPLSLVSQLYTDRDSTASNIAKYTPGVLAAPTLFEEARASLRGLRGLAHAGGKGAMLRGIIPLLGAFGTYGAVAASPIVGEKIIHNMLD